MSARSFAEEVGRHSGNLTPIPFDRSMCPTDKSFLDNMTDQDILDVPPHVMIHALRTAAQNGAQVISPRQIPSAYMLGRTHNSASQPFLHVTGCEANNRFKWPVPDGHAALDPSYLEDRTVVKHGAPLAKRSPASASPLTYASANISNPIHKKVLKAKANIDFQNREDVRGDPDALAANYAKAWGQVTGTFTSMGTVTLAHLTDLQRHAIAPDTAFARYLGPIHERRVISTSVGPSSADAFGPFYGVDWTALRVCAETKFALTVNTEGYSLREMAIHLAVSDYGHNDRPASLMVFHPRPGVAWCYAPNTFRVRPANDMNKASTPAVLRTEMATTHGQARVGDLMRLYTAAVTWRHTQEARATASVNPLSSGVAALSRAVAGTSTIGKTVGKHARTVFLDALVSAPLDARRMFSRTMSILVPVVGAINIDKRHPQVVNNVAKYVGKRFQLLDASINARMITGATSRAKSHIDWFASFLSMAPKEFRDLKCDSHGWSCLVARFVLDPPDDKWRKYASSITKVGLDAMKDAMTPIPSIPSDQDVDVRQMVALHCGSVAANKANMYGSSYAGVARAAFALATVYDEFDLHDLWKMFRIAGFLWMFRSRCAETVKVHICDPDTVLPTHGAFRYYDFPPPLGRRKVIAVIAPYTHYRALVKGLRQMQLLMDVDPDEKFVGRVTDQIIGWGELCDYEMMECDLDYMASEAVRKSAVTRYLINVDDLARDVEMFLTYSINDAIDAAKQVIRNVELNREQAARAELSRPAAVIDAVLGSASRVTAAIGAALDTSDGGLTDANPGDAPSTGMEFLDTIDEDEAVILIDDYSEGSVKATALLEAEYADSNEFLHAFIAYVQDVRAPSATQNALRG